MMEGCSEGECPMFRFKSLARLLTLLLTAYGIVALYVRHDAGWGSRA